MMTASFRLCKFSVNPLKILARPRQPRDFPDLMKTRLPLALMLAAVETAAAYDLHEWGTFTTVSGSDGSLLTGLQREEEPLPSLYFQSPFFAFVYP
jgi:hypothetical protein